MSIEGIEEKLDEVSGGCGKKPEIIKGENGKFHLAIGGSFESENEAKAYLKGVEDSRHRAHHPRFHLKREGGCCCCKDDAKS
ncbi:MAG: hypothetical protein LBK29_00390 [Oscillospiraceae bacterium]|jgi:hypothetical protein|nr:hypothetical protein [Oscillospiraceae bacterium]